MKRFLLFSLIASIACVASAQVTLDSCRHMALRNNKAIGIEKLKIEQAGYQRKQAEAAYKPTIDFGGAYLNNGRKTSLIDVEKLSINQYVNPVTGNYDFVLDPNTGIGFSLEGNMVNGVKQKLKDLSCLKRY